MLWKLSECIKNRFYAKSYTSRPHIPKIAVKLSKMAPPDRIKYRGSLTTAIVAKGLTWKLDFSQACSFYRMLMDYKNFDFTQIPGKTNDIIFLKSPETMLFGHFWPKLYMTLNIKLSFRKI